MAFKKGDSGNPNGRPKGSKNKRGGDLREKITAFLEDNFEKIQEDFKKMQPGERAKLYKDLLQYSIPKMQTTSMEMKLERMTDNELDEVMDELKGIVSDQEG